MPVKKERYTARVRRGKESIGEYVFNATPKGLQEFIKKIKPEFSYDILSRDGIIYKKEGTVKNPKATKVPTGKWLKAKVNRNGTITLKVPGKRK